MINWTAAAVILAAIIAVFQAGRFAVSKVFKLGKISERLNGLDKDVKGLRKELAATNKELRKEIKEVATNTADLRSDLAANTAELNNIVKLFSVKSLAASNSPRKLTPEGIKVLTTSGIDTIVDDKFDLIVKKVKALKPENPYQAEQAVLDVVSDFKKDPDLKDTIERGAFSSGYFVDSVVFAGGLYVRDRVLKELGMEVEEIDNHTPSP